MLKKVGIVKKKVDCPRNFQCLKIPEKDKREVKESDIEGFLECRECESFCPFKCSFGFTYLCVCPMRYPAK